MEEGVPPIVATSRPSSSRLRSSALRAAAASAAVVVALALTTGTSYAVPEPSAADTAQQIADLQHELEVVTEQFNEATIAREQKQAEADTANSELGVVQAQVESLTEEIGHIAAGVYTGDNMTSFGSFMTSDSPEDFLAKLNTLGAIGDHQNDILEDLTDAQTKALTLKETADTALAAAATSEQEAADKKAWIEATLPGLQEQLKSMTVDAGDAVAGTIIATGAAKIAVEAALSQRGVDYVWAGETPEGGFDCSGLTKWAYAQAGVGLPHSSGTQSTMGQAIPRDQVQAGDLVFFGSPVHHVGMAINNAQMVHAPQTGDVVKVAPIDSNSGYSGARRISNG